MPTRTFCSIVGLAILLSAQAVVQGHDSIRVEFTTSDGIAIVGDYWTPLDMSKPAPAVILLHMYKSDRSAWLPLVLALEEAGFAIMTIDLRGHGESTAREPRTRVKSPVRSLVFGTSHTVVVAVGGNCGPACRIGVYRLANV